jgi:hypothetical protein
VYNICGQEGNNTSQVTCKCSAQLGFAEWTDGRCYHEYLRGPCEEGEELVRKPFPVNATCLRHGCQEGEASLTSVPLTLLSPGEVKWPNRRCYRVVGDPLHPCPGFPTQSRIKDLVLGQGPR